MHTEVAGRHVRLLVSRVREEGAMDGCVCTHACFCPVLSRGGWKEQWENCVQSQHLHLSLGSVREAHQMDASTVSLLQSHAE